MVRKLKLLISTGVILCMLLASVLPAFAIASDINGHWAEEVITRWLESGMAKGYPDGTFRPNNSVTRAEFITLVNRAFKLTETVAINYSDVKAGSFAYVEISKAQAAGYITGYADGTIKPDKSVSRQEASVMLARLLKLIGPEDKKTLMIFNDWADITVSDRDAIGACVERGYFTGFPDKTFKPLDDITRAQAIVVLDRVLRDVEKRKQEIAAIGKLTITNGYIGIDLGDKSPVLKAEDFLVTATLDGRDYTLQNLIYNSSRNYFTFSPVSRIGSTQHLAITVAPAKNCDNLSGSASADMIIDAVLPPEPPSGSSLKTPPAVNADTSANSVDNDLVLTFSNGNDWAMAITSIKVDGVRLSDIEPVQFQLVEASLTLKPSNTPALQIPGNKTITIEAAGYSTVTITQTVTAGEAVAGNSIVSTQPVGQTVSGGLLGVQPVVTLKDRYGNICSTGPSMAMNVSASNNGSESWTLGGITTIAAQGGVSSFNNLTTSNNKSTAITNAFIRFTFGNASITSSSFTVPAAEASEQGFAATSPDIAYGGNGSYFAVYKSKRSDSLTSICGQLYDATGMPQGEEIIISGSEYTCYDPAIAYAYKDGTGKYLVVWSDERSGKDMDLYGQFVTANGQLNGGVFMISTDSVGSDNQPIINNQSKPDVIYDDFNGRFLVVWEDSVMGDRQTDIDGRFIAYDGTLSDNKLPFVDQDWTQNSPSIAYDRINNVYLLAYTNGTSGFHVFGQFINADGTLKGTAFFMIHPQTSASQSSPKLAYDSNLQRFILVWSDLVRVGDETKYVIKGQLIKYDVNYTSNTALILVGPNFNVSNTIECAEEPEVVYDASGKDFFVTWQDNRNEAETNYGFNDIYFRLVSEDGVPMGDADELVYSAINDQSNPVVVGNGNGQFLIIYESHETPVSVIIAVPKVVVPEPT